MLEQGIDLEEARRMLLERGRSRPEGSGSSSNQDIRWFSLPREGQSKIRFLPPWQGSKLPGVIIRRHYSLPEVKNFLCLKTHKMSCPICEVLEQFSGKVPKLDDFQSVSRAHFNVLVVDGPEPDVPQVLGTGDFNFYWLMEKILDPDVGDITDPRKGHDVTFKRKTPGGAFDRIISLKPRPISASEDKISEILSGMYKLNEIWKKPDDAYVAKAVEAADKLRDVLQNRVLTLGSATGTRPENAPVLRHQESATPAATESVLSSRSASASSSKPKGAPECFSDKMVWGETQQKCIVCHWEFQCSQEIKKAAKN